MHTLNLQRMSEVMQAVGQSPTVFYCPVITGVQAGFPSPAGDYMENPIDLNEHLIEHRAATFFMRATGESMIGANILPGALLVVDRALRPKDGSIVVAVVNGEFTIKRLDINLKEKRLLPENPKFKPIVITEGMEVQIWGVVRHVILDAQTL